MSTMINEIPIIDTDTHVVEPPDLWTSRVSSKWGDLVPHVEWDDDKQEEAWFTGTHAARRGRRAGDGRLARTPAVPPASIRARPTRSRGTPHGARALMDTYGVKAQILYPNVAVFDAKSIVGMGDTALQLACIEAYNDFLVDFGNEAPGRFIAVSGLPFWDLTATLAEIERCAANGHKGIVFTQDPSYFGLPQLTDRYWDPMWASAQEKGLPVNFHIASGDLDLFNVGHPDNGVHANYAAMGVSFFMANARTVAQLVTGGICHRFPELNFVSVESGIGWIPFALEALDWQWRNCGVHKEHPEYDLLPSEYFRRQIYGCFWFERDSALAAHRADRCRQHPLRDRLPAPHEHVARAGERRPAARRVPPRGVQRRRRRFVAQDPARQRGPHLPPRLKRPTARPSASGRPVASSRSRQNRAPVGHHRRAAVDRSQLLEPQFHRHPCVELGRAWHLADEVGARRLVEVDQHHRVRRGVCGMHLMGHDGPRVERGTAADGLPATVPAPAMPAVHPWHVQNGFAVVASAENELTLAAASKKPPVSRSSTNGSRRDSDIVARRSTHGVSPCAGSGRCRGAAAWT